jgi:propionaldehyde dehydrogenase
MRIDVDEQHIQKLVDDVVRRVKDRMNGGGGHGGVGTDPQPQAAPATARRVSSATARQVSPAASPNRGLRPASSLGAEGIYSDVESAVEAAQQAYEELMSISVRGREALIRAMREASIENANHLGALAVEETRLGRVSAKVQKILLAARKTPGTEDLDPLAYTGDDGLTLVEPAPFGVIGAITPSTNPPSTVINNTISMVASGNAVVINPHPSAKRVSNETVRVLNRAISAAGGPDHLICSIAEPTLETGQAVMSHPGVKLLLVTGGGAVVKAAMTCGKKAVAAGPGNPPVIVDDTANITRAGRNIVDGASFDNNVLCIAEKEIFCFENVADRLKEEMLRHGTVELRGSQRDALVDRCLDLSDSSHPRIRTDMAGKDASVLLKEIGLSAHPDVRLVLAEVDDPMHPLVQAEQLTPFIPLVRVRNLDEGLEWALQAEHGFRHTAIMHSEHVSRMSRVARAVETTIFVKNAPSYAGLGFGGEGYTTLSIATPTGEGLTSARTFTRQRRCVLAGSFRII